MRHPVRAACAASLLALAAAAPAAPPKDAPLADLKEVAYINLPGHGGEVGAAGVSRDGKLVATASYDRKVRVFDAAGKLVRAFDFGDAADNKPDRLGIRSHGLQNGVVFDPDGKRVAAVGGNWMAPPAGLATVFDVAANKGVFTTRAHKQMVRRAAFSPDGSTLVTAGHDGKLKVFDAATGAERGTFAGHDWVVTAVAFAPDGKTVASACCMSSRSLKLWDPAAPKESRELPFPRGVYDLHDLAFSPDGKQLAAVSDGCLRLWDVATGKLADGVVVDAGLFTRVAWSPDGKRVAVAGTQGNGDGRGDKGILRVVDVAAGTASLALVDPAAGKGLLAVAWPEPDRILAVGARGSAAKLVTVRLNK